METKVKRLSHPKERKSHQDFIVNKLARLERGAVDERDVESVLVRQAGKLDNEYLTERAQQAEVQAILQTIQSS